MTGRLTGAIAILSFLLGCQTIDNKDDVPAIIESHNEASLAELRHAVNSALGTDVLVSDSAFLESSTISIERRPPSTIERPEPIGRDYSMPIKFNLVKRAERCYLIDTRTNTRYLLESANCSPE